MKNISKFISNSPEELMWPRIPSREGYLGLGRKEMGKWQNRRADLTSLIQLEDISSRSLDSLPVDKQFQKQRVHFLPGESSLLIRRSFKTSFYIKNKQAYYGQKAKLACSFERMQEIWKKYHRLLCWWLWVFQIFPEYRLGLHSYCCFSSPVILKISHQGHP